MNSKAIKIFTVAIVCLAPVGTAQVTNTQRKEKPSSGVSLSEIREYRKMIRLNDRPINMIEQTKYLCAAQLPIHGPHYDPGIVYYINETAQKGITSFTATKQFPVGAIIVKEKQEKKTEDSVQIITVMKKIRPGKTEDSWAYKMLDVKTWEVVDYTKGKENVSTNTCIGCHRHYKRNDYVSDTGFELLSKR